MVVMMKGDMWRLLDGDTPLVLLENLADTLPQDVRIQHQGIELIIIEYESWIGGRRQGLGAGRRCTPVRCGAQAAGRA